MRGASGEVTKVEALVAPDSPTRGLEADAFERLFAAEYATVVRIAHRVLADAEEAEDVAQEVFIDFHRRYRADVPFAAAWLRAGAAHAALNAVRSRKRRERRESAHAADEAERAIDPQDAAVANERRRAVRDALGRLPRKAAAVLVLRHSGLSYAEVAAALGVNVGQIGTLLRRAEDRLRKELAP